VLLNTLLNFDAHSYFILYFKKKLEKVSVSLLRQIHFTMDLNNEIMIFPFPTKVIGLPIRGNMMFSQNSLIIY
jgi:hypothetical protein